MKKQLKLALAGAAFLALSNTAYAQFGGLGKIGGGSASSAEGVSAETIVKKYAGGTQSVLRADANMLAALGKKEDAERMELHAKNLTEGPTKDAFEEATKLQTESSKILESEMSGNKVAMDAESKKKFAAGVGELAKGVMQYVSMTSDAKSFKPSVTSIGGAAGAAVYIVKNLPDSIKNLGGTLKKAIAFSKANNIPLPKEAAEATAGLPD